MKMPKGTAIIAKSGAGLEKKISQISIELHEAIISQSHSDF
jgi:hypothetical protein